MPPAIDQVPAAAPFLRVSAADLAKPSILFCLGSAAKTGKSASFWVFFCNYRHNADPSLFRHYQKCVEKVSDNDRNPKIGT